MESINKETPQLQYSIGAVRDLTNSFVLARRKAHTKAPKKSEQDFLRERFKPLNKKFNKLSNGKKEKVEDDEKHLRLSTLSDDNSQEIIVESNTKMFKGENNK